MILSDQRIGEAVKQGRIDIDPWREDQLNPASYDLTLAPELMVAEWAPPWSKPSSVHLQPLNLADVTRQPPYLRPHVLQLGRPYIIEPGEFLLASTVERVTLSSHLAARVEGKSSLARVGLAAHVTGGFIDPGFEGNITLEVVNMLHRPLMLHPRMRIAQIAFTPVLGGVTAPYGRTGRYQGQTGPTPSRYRMEGFG